MLHCRKVTPGFLLISSLVFPFIFLSTLLSGPAWSADASCVEDLLPPFMLTGERYEEISEIARQAFPAGAYETNWAAKFTNLQHHRSAILQDPWLRLDLLSAADGLNRSFPKNGLNASPWEKQYFTLINDLILKDLAPKIIHQVPISPESPEGFAVDLDFMLIDHHFVNRPNDYPAPQPQIASIFWLWLTSLKKSQNLYLKFDGEKFYLAKASPFQAIQPREFKNQVERQCYQQRYQKQLNEDIPFFFQTPAQILASFEAQKNLQGQYDLWKKFFDLAEYLTPERVLPILVNGELDHQENPPLNGLRAYLQAHQMAAFSPSIYFARLPEIYDLYRKAVDARLNQILASLGLPATSKELYLDFDRTAALSSWPDALLGPVFTDQAYLGQIIGLFGQTLAADPTLERLRLTISDLRQEIPDLLNPAPASEKRPQSYFKMETAKIGLVAVDLQMLTDNPIETLAKIRKELHHILVRQQDFYLAPALPLARNIFPTGFLISEISGRRAELAYLQRQIKFLFSHHDFPPGTPWVTKRKHRLYLQHLCSIAKRSAELGLTLAQHTNATLQQLQTFLAGSAVPEFTVELTAYDAFHRPVTRQTQYDAAASGFSSSHHPTHYLQLDFRIPGIGKFSYRPREVSALNSTANLKASLQEQVTHWQAQLAPWMQDLANYEEEFKRIRQQIN